MRLSPLDPLGEPGFHVRAGNGPFSRRPIRGGRWSGQTGRCAEQPDYRPALRVKTICCAYLGRIDEAHGWLSRLIELDPGLTIAGYKAVGRSTFRRNCWPIYVDGLRKAGLPEG